MRLFIAVELPDEIKKALERIKEEIKDLRSARLVHKDNIHITMKFLGDVKEEDADKVKCALASVSFESFALSLGSIGVFPDEKRMRVLWVEAIPEQGLISLKIKIDIALPQFKEDHSFKSHITIARFSFLAEDEMERIIELLQTAKIEKEGFFVNSFTLFKSTLTPKGPCYEKLGVYNSCSF